MIHVCSLRLLGETVARTGARQVVTLINRGTPVERPKVIAPDRHLFVGVNDIVEHSEGMVLPQERHVADLLAFVRGWDRAAPLVIHCYAGVSRSTAAAFIAALALDPRRDARQTANDIRRLSPTATPNIRLVTLADRMLGRDGAMIEAITAIGRGEDCFEGVPFGLTV